MKIVLLDIDGVFNPIKKLDKPIIVKHPWGLWQIAEENIEFLKFLSENCECYWISTWGQESNYLNRYIGIKEFECVYKDSKEQTVKKFTKPIDIIIDDELELPLTLHINPDSMLGLTEKEREIIYEYICNE